MEMAREAAGVPEAVRSVLVEHLIPNSFYFTT
jgi:hypothetical protein